MMLRADTRTLRGLLLPMLVVMAALLSLIKVSGLLEAVKKKRRFIQRADHDLDAFSDEFDRACYVP